MGAHHYITSKSTTKKFDKLLVCRDFIRGRENHIICDMIYCACGRWDFDSRIYKRRKGFCRLAIAEYNSANFYNSVLNRIETCCLNIKCNEFFT